MFIDKYIIHSDVYLGMKYNINNNNITTLYVGTSIATITAQYNLNV